MLQQNLLHFYSPQTAQYRSSLRRSWNETSFSKPPSVLAVETDSGEWRCIYGQSMAKVHTIMCTQNTDRTPGPMEPTMTMVMGAHNLQDWLNKCTKIRPADSFFFFFLPIHSRGAKGATRHHDHFSQQLDKCHNHEQALV